MKNFEICAVLDELDWDPVKAWEIGRELGIVGFYLRMFTDKYRFPHIPKEYYDWLNDVVDTDGDKIIGLSPALAKTVYSEREANRQLTDDLKLSLDFARATGVKQITSFTWLKTKGAQCDSDGNVSPSIPDDAIHSLAEMAKRLELDDGIFLIENNYACWGDTGVAAAQIITKANTQNVRLQWDPGSSLAGLVLRSRYNTAVKINRAMDILLNELEQVVDLIENVHVRDAVITSSGWKWVPLGEGIINWKILIEQLQKHGYKGPLTIEHHVEREGIGARHALHYLQSILD